jgi:hypothetical protein
MLTVEKQYRVQYWSKSQDGRRPNHAVKAYDGYNEALLSYLRDVQDASLGLRNIARIRLEKMSESGWKVVYECCLKFQPQDPHE